jgi:triacylglycerol lipase
MNEIPPNLAADLAKDVYRLIEKGITVDEAVEAISRRGAGIFKISLPDLTQARTGGPGFIKCETAFGMMVYGTGDFYKSHAFIVLRGSRILGDWLTNANFVLTSRSAGGHSVHDGFYQAFKSFRAQVDSFIAGFGQQGITTVHCIGHSLGGALATL